MRAKLTPRNRSTVSAAPRCVLDVTFEELQGGRVANRSWVAFDYERKLRISYSGY